MTLIFPASLSSDSYQDLEDRLEIVLRGLKRRLAPATTGREAGAQLPFMITSAQKQQLREMGHDDDAISKMTPEQAHKALGLFG